MKLLHANSSQSAPKPIAREHQLDSVKTHLFLMEITEMTRGLVQTFSEIAKISTEFSSPEWNKRLLTWALDQQVGLNDLMSTIDRFRG